MAANLKLHTDSSWFIDEEASMIGFDDPSAPNNTFMIMNEVVGLLAKNRYPGGLPPK